MVISARIGIVFVQSQVRPVSDHQVVITSGGYHSAAARITMIPPALRRPLRCERCTWARSRLAQGAGATFRVKFGVPVSPAL